MPGAVSRTRSLVGLTAVTHLASAAVAEFGESSEAPGTDPAVIAGPHGALLGKISPTRQEAAPYRRPAWAAFTTPAITEAGAGTR